MKGHRPFAELCMSMAPERRARDAEATHGILPTMVLHEQQQARGNAPAALPQDLHAG